MIKYQSTTHKHSTSSPQIESIFLRARLSAAAISPQRQVEKQQINSIRHMGKYLFDALTDSQVTFEPKSNLNISATSHTPKNNQLQTSIYERSQKTKQHKLQNKMISNRKQAQKIDQLANTSRNTLNQTKNNTTKSSAGSQSHLQIYKKKQTYMMSQVLKKCIKEEKQFYTIRERQKQLNYSKTNSYLKNESSQNHKFILQPNKASGIKAKKTATKNQLEKIFEEVNKRGLEIKTRKQAKIKKYRQQNYQKEMRGVTFYPELQSSLQLRKKCSAKFGDRLKEDDRNREMQKMKILKAELQRDSFEPHLNYQRNSLSKSKINSLRLQDSVFITNRSKPQLNFEKNLSKFIYPQQQSLSFAESKDGSAQIPVNAKDLNFLFQ